jgi:hypothetical protein
MQRSTGSFHASVPLREVFRLPRLSSAGWTSLPDDISTHFTFTSGRTKNTTIQTKGRTTDRSCVSLELIKWPRIL